ncbi:MAG: SDR family oxidoreductase [Gammaproteobacteria bacterium]|nr:SDR family oxidoreductase [Gammaproteobacteria bacterium]
MITSTSILITGASGGIGRAAAIECANKGARIGVHYHSNRERAEAVLAALPGDGHRLFQCDIADADAIENLIEAADTAFDGLDVLVNNAGIAEWSKFEDMDYAAWQESWQRVIETNLTGPGNLCFCAGKKMITRAGGRIVNVSSRGAFRGEPLMPWYGASKAGMNAMGQSLAQALGPLGVYVYTVAPGFVETEMAAEVLASPEGDNIRNQSSMGRVAQPEEVAKTICFLALDAPQFMTGCIVDVNGASYLRS